MERDNGLEADTFVFLGTVSPRMSDDLLDDLAAEGIAAYAVSTEPDERIYVDRRSHAYAQALLRRGRASAEPGGAGSTETADSPDAMDTAARATRRRDETPSDDDEAWQRLVADFDRDDDGDRSWPDAENVDTDAEKDDDGDTVGSRGAKVTVVRLDTDDDQADEPDDDHFVRPDPPSLPAGDLWIKGAWLLMLLAIAYPVVGLILDRRMPGWSIALAVVAFVGGIVIHVLRIRAPRADDSDDGAVV